LITIENSTLNLILTQDSETTIIRKDNCRVLVFSDIVRLTDFEFNIYEFDYTTVSDPSEASAEALGDTLNDYLNNSVGGGGGGTVKTVNAGTNISVTGTATDPIVNSLSDRYRTSSVTSNTVSNGAKTFAVDLNLSYIPLQEILVVYDVSNHMHGEVTSYNPATGSLVVDIKKHTGSGTYTSWTINLDGTPVDAISGVGVANEIAYFTGAQVLGSLAVATYPSLTELSYVKGVTSAIQTQMNTKAPLASPAFTGSPTAPTQSPSDNSNNLATTAFVQTAVDDIDYLLTYSFRSTYNY
jgi:hypothetical protein